MLSLILFIAFIAAIFLGGQWLMAHPGQMVIHWFGYDITMHIAVVALPLLSLVSLTTGRGIRPPMRTCRPERRLAAAPSCSPNIRTCHYVFIAYQLAQTSS